MNVQHNNISAEEARKMLGPSSEQLSDGEVIKFVKLIVALYEDFIQSKKPKAKRG